MVYPLPYRCFLSILLLLSVAFFSSLFLPLKAAPMRSDTLSKKKLLELNLSTTGDVSITGNTLATKFSFQPPMNGKDSLVHVRTTEQGTALISREDKKYPSHQSLRIEAPKNQDLLLHKMNGALRVSGLQGHIKGVMEGGNISIENLAGNVEIFTAKGDIHLKEVEGAGNIATRAGNILLEDADPRLYGFTYAGKVTRKVTSNYYKKRTKKPLFLAVQGEELIIEAPYGAWLSTTNANLEILQAKDSLVAQVLEGNIALKAEGSVKATSSKGSILATYTGNLQSTTEQIELVAEGGDITLYLPATLSATFMIDQQQTNQHKGNYILESEFDLGDSSAKAVKNTSNEIAYYQTQVYKKIGTGTCLIKLRAINGNIYLKKRAM
jgi:DUF4097 and DUF4098 domain-containing protein YvlB